MTVYFGTYDYFKSKNYHPLLSGALAGLSNWTLTYPIDVIKSRQIAQNLSIREAIRYGNVWKGIHICLCTCSVYIHIQVCTLISVYIHVYVRFKVLDNHNTNKNLFHAKALDNLLFVSN